MKNYVIIVAGGKGQRMDSELPKQFINLSGKPVILHTIHKFHLYDPFIEKIIVIPPGYRDNWSRLIQENQLNIQYILVDGGRERFHSVKNALEHITGEGIVAVHDAVRPLVSIETIRRSFEMAREKGCAVPCIDIPETVRSIYPEGSKTISRDNLKIIQTPQVFHSKILKESYQVTFRKEFTDDATVVEQAGHTIHLVEGNTENIKITTRKDLKLAEYYLTHS